MAAALTQLAGGAQRRGRDQKKPDVVTPPSWQNPQRRHAYRQGTLDPRRLRRGSGATPGDPRHRRKTIELRGAPIPPKWS